MAFIRVKLEFEDDNGKPVYELALLNLDTVERFAKNKDPKTGEEWVAAMTTDRDPKTKAVLSHTIITPTWDKLQELLEKMGELALREPKPSPTGEIPKP